MPMMRSCVSRTATILSSARITDQYRSGSEKWPINRNWTAGRAVIDKEPVHVHDLQSAEKATISRSRRTERAIMGHRTILSVPMLREGESIGAIVLRRTEVHPFSDKQIALLQTFADQAVIAIGNVRLFEEVQAKTRDLTESLEQQTATSEVLEVISSTPGDLEPVFDKMLENATRVCGANFGTMNLWKMVSSPALHPTTCRRPMPTRPIQDRSGLIRKAAWPGHREQSRRIQILDLLDSPAYLDGDPAVTSIVRNARSTFARLGADAPGYRTRSAPFRCTGRRCGRLAKADRAAEQFRQTGSNRHREHAAAKGTP